MTNNWLPVLTILLALAAPLTAQTTRATLTGTVVDTTGTAIPDVRISIGTDTSRVWTSDSGGVFRLVSLPVGSTLVRFRRLGYVPAEFAIELVADEPVRIRVELSPLPPVLAPVEVRETAAPSPGLHARGFYDRRRQRETGALSGTFIDPEEIARRRPLNTSQLLEALPGVTVERRPNGRNIPIGNRVSWDGRARMGRRCQYAVFVDGHEIDPMAVQGSGIDHLVPVSTVKAMEVYTSPSGTPERFQTTRLEHPCGSIVIWTRVD